MTFFLRACRRPEGAQDGRQGPLPGPPCERARRQTPTRQTGKKVTGGLAVTFFLGAFGCSPKGPNKLPGARNKAPSYKITPETLGRDPRRPKRAQHIPGTAEEVE